MSGSHISGLPDLLQALYICLYQPSGPVLRSPLKDGLCVGIHYHFALSVGGGVWISSADVEVSTDVV